MAPYTPTLSPVWSKAAGAFVLRQPIDHGRLNRMALAGAGIALVIVGIIGLAIWAVVAAAFGGAP